MSRPYININSLTYTQPILTLNYTFYKLRGGGTMSILGFSHSFDYLENLSHSETSKGVNSKSVTFSVGALGTNSSTTFIDPASLTYTFGGTATANVTNTKFNLHGINIVSATATGPTLSNYLNSIVNGMVFSGANLGYSATATSNKIIFSAPVNQGNFHNGTTVSMAVSGAPGTFTYSTITASFSGGLNVHMVSISFNNLGYNSLTKFYV